MPAGAPQQALDRRFLLADLALGNTGADVTVNYQNGAFNRATGAILIGGDNAYVGLLSDGIYGDLIEGAVLPAIPGSPITDVAVNKITGEWLVLGANRLFRMAADLSASVEITPPSATTKASVIEWQGRIFVGRAFQTVPNRNVEFSDDDGATWSVGIFTGFTNVVDGLYSDVGETVLLAIQRGTDFAAFTKTPGAATATWTTIPTANNNIPMSDAAVSDDGRAAVLMSNVGDLTTTADSFNTFVQVAPADNPLKRSALFGFDANAVEFVADLGGFVVQSNAGGMLFIAQADMSVLFQGSYIGDPLNLGRRCGVSDGTQALFAGGTNQAAMTLRRIGQLAKT